MSRRWYRALGWIYALAGCVLIFCDPITVYTGGLLICCGLAMFAYLATGETMPNSTTPNFRKDGSARVADLPAVTGLELDMVFEQKAGGFGARLRNAFSPADPDLVAAALVGDVPVDYVEPKHRRSVLNGALVHRGDAAGAGTETLAVNVEALLAEDNDIDGLAIGALCTGHDGFSRVAGIAVRLYDTSTGTRKAQGVVRFNVTTTDTAVVIATLHRTATGWQVRNDPTFSRVAEPSNLLHMFSAQMRRITR